MDTCHYSKEPKGGLHPLSPNNSTPKYLYYHSSAQGSRGVKSYIPQIKIIITNTLSIFDKYYSQTPENSTSKCVLVAQHAIYYLLLYTPSSHICSSFGTEQVFFSTSNLMSVLAYSERHMRITLGVALVMCVLTAFLTWQLTRQHFIQLQNQSSETKFYVLLAVGSAATLLLQWVIWSCCRKSCRRRSSWIPSTDEYSSAPPESVMVRRSRAAGYGAYAD